MKETEFHKDEKACRSRLLHPWRRVLLMTLVLVTLLGIAPQPVAAQEDSGPDVVAEFISASHLNPGSVAVKVVDLSTGEVVASHNSDAPLIPASIMKSVTIASLLNVSDLDDQYITKAYTCGRVHEGVLEGNLLVVGSGDPSLNSRRGPESPDLVQEIIGALKKKGIKRIDGRIKVDQSIYPLPAHPASWVSGDMARSYGAGCYGFNFQQNSSGDRSVQNPAGVFETMLKKGMQTNGMEIMGEEIADGKKTLLMSHESAPLDEIMRSCMMRSDNLYAEAFLRSYALANGADATPAEGARLEMDYWKKRKVPMEGVQIVDGSGLSRSNRVTADFITGVLTKMSGNPYYASFFPLAGQEGTLKNLLKNTRLEGYLAMKTGSMNGIQCYAGYKLDDDYAPTHSVVIIINNMQTSRDTVRRQVAQMLEKIFPNG